MLGQSHLVKTVENIHEALVQTVRGIKFGVAFWEAFGVAGALVCGTDGAMIEFAK